MFTLHISAWEDKNMCMCRGVDSQLMKKWLRTYKTTHFDHPLMLTKTCLRWLIYLFNRFFVEEMARALKNNFLSVPRFHAFDANDSQCK